MIKILHPFLRYSNKDAIHNPIQIFLYAIAYPIALILNKIKLSPNLVTITSTIFAVFAFVSLIKSSLFLFYIFWSISYILDYADGTLARMINKVGRNALRIDHVSDHIKVILILLGFGIYYECQELWILLFLASGSFLFYSILNHDLSSNIKLSQLKFRDSQKEIYENNSIKYLRENLLIKFSSIRYIYRFIFGTFYLINGHTLIIILFIPIEYNYAWYLLLYFILICVVHSLHRLLLLSKYPKI